ncbi:hypothetical protein [Granulicella sibirica]|uniref:Uncharacterized protein n=1 Tax=Granulicella sibirica TaxID=2479048 RepID=A0A4Q0SWZ3_9BACT|nr:hypothetical protein [Granulicella sibirica]RXH55635.1 hypothetical protein GRAN_2492 [Granulicella sibirica]
MASCRSFGVKAGTGLIAMTLFSGAARAELCTTQSQMSTADRDQLAGAARSLSLKLEAGDANGVQAVTVPEYVKDFSGIAYVVTNTAPKIKNAPPTVDQIYLLDASAIKKQADGSVPDAQFFCSLNRSPMETDFVIPGLPPGKYGFAMVNFPAHPVPWRISILFRQEGGQWLLAGLYPQAQTAAGHDGLWYWKGARDLSAEKQPWSAWLYYQQAQSLLRPAGFVQSTHLEKLRTEQGKAAPPVLSDGIGPDTPLVVKGPDGTEYRFTSLDTDDSLAKDKVDIAVHLKAEAIADPAAARKRNVAAMTALLTVYPELRKPFHGVWVFADTGGQGPFATEQAMSEIP